MAEPTQKALIARHVGAIPLGLHAHRHYLERHGTPGSWDELARHRLIGFDRQTAFVRSIAQRIPQMASARFSLRADSNLTQLAAVRAGCGIGVCQVQLARRSEGLVRVLADSFEVPLHTWIVMHEDLRDSPRCRVTFDALVKGLTGHVIGAAML